jgi:hypothetical protein
MSVEQSSALGVCGLASTLYLPGLEPFSPIPKGLVPERGLPLHFGGLTFAIIPNVDNSEVQFFPWGTAFALAPHN